MFGSGQGFGFKSLKPNDNTQIKKFEYRTRPQMGEGLQTTSFEYCKA